MTDKNWYTFKAIRDVTEIRNDDKKWTREYIKSENIWHKKLNGKTDDEEITLIELKNKETKQTGKD